MLIILHAQAMKKSPFPVQFRRQKQKPEQNTIADFDLVTETGVIISDDMHPRICTLQIIFGFR